MQRRAAAVYFALFVVLGAGAYTFMQVGMSQPAIELDAPTYGQGDELSAGGQSYTISSIEASAGSGGEVTRVANVTYQNESFRATDSADNGSTVTLDGEEYQVSVASGDNASSFSFVEQQNVSAILASDPAVENETAERGDETYVFYENGSRALLSDYLPEPAVQGPYSAGDQLEWPTDGGTTTARIDSVSASSVAVSWDAPQRQGIEMEEGANATLGGTQHLAHFPDNSTVQIGPTDQYWDAYQGELEAQSYYQERRNGFWGIVLLSFVGAVLLLAAAYLPTKG